MTTTKKEHRSQGHQWSKIRSQRGASIKKKYATGHIGKTEWSRLRGGLPVVVLNKQHPNYLRDIHRQLSCDALHLVMTTWSRSWPEICTATRTLRRVLHEVYTTKRISSTFMVGDIDLSTRHGELNLGT